MDTEKSKHLWKAEFKPAYVGESILVTRGNEHPEERIPLYKPVFSRTLARIWSEDKTTGIATGANKPECEACATEHSRLVEVARSAGKSDGYKEGLEECQVRIERIKREIEKRGLVTRPDGTITEDVETVIEISDMDWWQEFWEREGIK